MRIPTLLQKINDLATKPEQRTAIDVDLMLDYTRVLYADLLDWRAKLADMAPAPLQMQSPAPTPQIPKPPAQVFAQPNFKEPTLAELAEAMEREAALEKDSEDVSVMAAKPEPIPVTIPVQKTGEEVQTHQTPTSHKAENVTRPFQRDRRDIRSMISINDKYQIMSELFGNDKQAYEQALDYINQSNNESNAMQWLREQLWITEDHSDAALSFYDIVSRYFKV